MAALFTEFRGRGRERRASLHTEAAPLPRLQPAKGTTTRDGEKPSNPEENQPRRRARAAKPAAPGHQPRRLPAYAAKRAFN